MSKHIREESIGAATRDEAPPYGWLKWKTDASSLDSLGQQWSGMSIEGILRRSSTAFATRLDTTFATRLDTTYSF